MAEPEEVEVRMDMLTIGAFARACRLSPKALRLYDELELLRPARVDPDTGYRYYAVDQLEQARLVAWLRRLGMPLAGIRQVCSLEPAAAASEIRAFWARVEAETAVRRDLAGFLVDHLTAVAAVPGKDTTMLELRYSAHSDRGRVRPSNQDAAYAGNRLLAVADGCGPAGAPASTAAVEALRFLDTEELAAGSVLNLLEDAVQGASQAVRDVADGSEEVGTTLTALLWTGSQFALVHIGDSRAYLLRGSGLFRITHDHTVVQSMIDEGRLTPEEATAHPQRALLLKALTGGTPPLPDLRLHDAQPGDRFLLCSDGLSGVVPDARIGELLGAATAPDEAVRALVDAANGAGRPGQRDLCGGRGGGDGGSLTDVLIAPRPRCPPQGRGAVSICGSATWALPARPATHTRPTASNPPSHGRIGTMSTDGTNAHASAARLPALVERALAAARAQGFPYSCRPEQGRLLHTLAAGAATRIGETGTGLGVGLAWLAEGAGAGAGVSIISVERDAERAHIAAELFVDRPEVTVLHGDWRRIEEYGPYDLLVLDGGGQGKAPGDTPADVTRLLAPGGTVVVDDFTPATSWPPRHEGAPDRARLHWLEHPALRAVELRLAPDLSTVVGTRHLV